MRILIFLSTVFFSYFAFSQPQEAVASFDGGSYLELTDIGSSGTLREITLSVWVYHDVWLTADQEAIGDCLENGGFGLQLYNHEIQAGVMRDGYYFASYPASYLMPGWHHFALTYDGSKLGLYVDGLLKKALHFKSSVPVVYPDHRLPLFIGAALGGNNHPEKQSYIHGKIDQLIIYNQALNPETIWQIYKGRPDDSIVPILEFDFEQCDNGCQNVHGEEKLKQIGTILFGQVNFWSPHALGYYTWLSFLVLIVTGFYFLRRKYDSSATTLAIWIAYTMLLLDSFLKLPGIWVWMHTERDWLNPSPFAFMAVSVSIYSLATGLKRYLNLVRLVALLVMVSGILSMVLPAPSLIYSWISVLILVNLVMILVLFHLREDKNILFGTIGFLFILDSSWLLFYTFGISHDYLTPFSNVPAVILLVYIITKVKPESAVEKESSITRDFSKREKEVAMMIMQGHSDQEISDQLFISINTTRTHIKNVYKKLGISTRSKAIVVLRDQPQLLD